MVFHHTPTGVTGDSLSPSRQCENAGDGDRTEQERAPDARSFEELNRIRTGCLSISRRLETRPGPYTDLDAWWMAAVI
jgi:hypothetical protein